jgi:transcriptional regulator with XRE-family HTH domain
MSEQRHAQRMDDLRIGAALRAIRIRKRWRQADLAARAGVSPTIVGRIERGDAGTLPLAKLRRVAGALGARVETFVRWDGADLARLLDARHAAMHEAVAGLLASADGWVFEPEVSFSLHGERGIIDILAWHPGRRMLLVIELKTEIVEVGMLLSKMDQRRRLAGNVARPFGWDPVAISTWVVLADSRTNRRALAAHRRVLRAKFPIDGRSIRRWMRDPRERIDALGFLPERHVVQLGRDIAPVRRVRAPRARTISPDAGVPDAGNVPKRP